MMWLATGTGVASYDGCNWRQWHGSSEGAWAFVHPRSSDAFITMTEHSPVHIAEVKQDNWDISPAAPLPAETIPKFICAAKNSTVIAGTAVHGIATFADGQWNRLLIDGEMDYPVCALTCHQNTLFVGTHTGLWKIDLGNTDRTATRFRSIPDAAVVGLAIDRDRLWVAQNDWVRLITLDGSEVQKIGEGTDVTFENETVIIEPDRRGAVILGGYRGVFRLEPDGNLVKWGRTQGLVDDNATDIEVDREGNIWIASMRGISKIVADGIRNYSIMHGLLADEVSSVCPQPDGTIILGHEHGLTLMANGERTKLPFNGNTPRQRVLDLEATGDGSTWIAASDLGFGKLTPDRKIIWHEYPGHAQTVVVWNDKLMVGGTTGLQQFKSGEWLEPDCDDPLLDVAVRRLLVDNEGRLWGCTATHGIWCLERDYSLKNWRPNKSRECDIYAVCDWQGRIMVGSRAGLLEIVGTSMAPASDYQIQHPVYALTSHKAPHPPRNTEALWIGTSAGTATAHDGRLIWYTPSDGLLGHEVNRDALAVASNGDIYIGTNAGLNTISARSPSPDRARPSVEITNMEHSTSAVRFQFWVNSFLNEEHVEFTYMLEGFRDEWLGPRTFPSRVIHFHSLEPGDYRLKLIAHTPDGRRSNAAISQTLTIPTPIYRQGWFIFAALLIGTTLILGTLINLAQRRYANRLESEVAVRTDELANSEQLAQLERRKYATTMQSIADGVAASDPNGKIFLWNAAAEHLTGISQETAIGKDIHDLLGLPHNTTPLGNTRIRLDGVNRDEDSFEAMVASYGDGKQIVVAFRDIRQLVADERNLAHQQRLESLGLLAGGIAHDFNNYLTVILGTLTMLEKEKALSSDQHQQVQLANATVARAEELTKQLLTFSTGGAPNRSTVDLKQLIKDATTIALSGSPVASSLIVQPDLAHAKVDHGQISQVFHNLMINARQAMPDGGELTVRAKRLDDNRPGFDQGAWIAIEVEDNGPGMSPDTLPRIFEPFFSRSDSTGLGLSVAHSIITRHGGQISVQSKEGHGTKFEILLPATNEDITKKKDTSTVISNRLHILVMDDEPSVLNMLASMLTHLGHKPVAVSDGAIAVEQYAAAAKQGTPFDLALFDLTVAGGVGGSEAAKRLLKDFPTARLVAVSGYSTDSILGRYAENGFCDAMAKPFSIETLKQTIARVSITEGDSPSPTQ